MQVVVQVVHAALDISALIAERARGHAPVPRRPDLDCSELVPEKVELPPARVLAAEEDLADPTVTAQDIALFAEPPHQVWRHTQQSVHAVVGDRVGDLRQIGVRTHRKLHGLQAFKRREETEETTVESAAGEEVHHPIRPRIEPRGEQPLARIPHLRVVFRIAERRPLGRTGTPSAVEIQPDSKRILDRTTRREIAQIVVCERTTPRRRAVPFVAVEQVVDLT